MFVRVIHDKSRTRPRWRVVVVKSQRFGAKVRQKVIREIGTAYDEATAEQLRAEGQLHILTLREQELNGTPPLLSSPTLATIRQQAHQQFEQQQKEQQQQERQPREQPQCAVESPPVDTVVLHDLYLSGEEISAGNLVWSEVYSRIGWDHVLGVRRRAANRILKDIVLAQLEHPRSKRRAVAEYRSMQGAPLTENRVYQTMDYLDEARRNKIQKHWRQRAQGLLSGPINAVLYDTTTLAFQSAREDLGELRRKGYSKDGKPHDVQVLFALLTTPEGLPLGYRVYPGNRYEGHTLLEALESLPHEGFPDHITVIADAGLCNQQNQALLQEQGYHYVLGRGARTLPKQWHAQLFARSHYQDATLPDQTPLKMLVLQDEHQRIIVTHSEVRARKDAHQREELVRKLRSRIGTAAPSKKFMSGAYCKFLNLTQAGTVEVNETAIANDARWDGLHAIVTDRTNPQADLTLLTQYRELWQIEDCFRTQKHNLRIRPVYHWKDRRVHAHLAICFMAFCCLQELRFRLRARDLHFPVRELLTRLDQARLSLVTTDKDKKQYVLTRRLPSDMHKLLRSLDLHWPLFSFELPKKS